VVLICAVEDVQGVVAVANSDETMVKIPVRLVPTALKAPMQATETKAAMRPYSMAVAPLSSFRNFANFVHISYISYFQEIWNFEAIVVQIF
jgi:hypothetical protein